MVKRVYTGTEEIKNKNTNRLYIYRLIYETTNLRLRIFLLPNEGNERLPVIFSYARRVDEMKLESGYYHIEPFRFPIWLA